MTDYPGPWQTPIERQYRMVYDGTFEEFYDGDWHPVFQAPLKTGVTENSIMGAITGGPATVSGLISNEVLDDPSAYDTAWQHALVEDGPVFFGDWHPGGDPIPADGDPPPFVGGGTAFVQWTKDIGPMTLGTEGIVYSQHTYLHNLEFDFDRGLYADLPAMPDDAIDREVADGYAYPEFIEASIVGYFAEPVEDTIFLEPALWVHQWNDADRMDVYPVGGLRYWPVQEWGNPDHVTDTPSTVGPIGRIVDESDPPTEFPAEWLNRIYYDGPLMPGRLGFLFLHQNFSPTMPGSALGVGEAVHASTVTFPEFRFTIRGPVYRWIYDTPQILNAPPLRRTPSDNPGASSAKRMWPPAKARQAGNRRAGGTW